MAPSTQYLRELELPNYPNIMRAGLYALLLAVEHTKTRIADTCIPINNLNSICLLLNHIRNPSPRYTDLDKLLITYIVHPILKLKKLSPHNITFQKVRAHTNILGNDEDDKLAKKGGEELHIMCTSYHHIGHPTPCGPSIPPTSTRHDGLVRNLKSYIGKEYKSAHISRAQIQYQILMISLTLMIFT